MCVISWSCEKVMMLKFVWFHGHRRKLWFFFLLPNLTCKRFWPKSCSKSCQFWEFFCLGSKVHTLSVQPKVLTCKLHNFNFFNLLTLTCFSFNRNAARFILNDLNMNWSQMVETEWYTGSVTNGDMNFYKGI